MRRLGSSLRRALARVGKTALSRVVTAIGRSRLLRGDVEGAVASFEKAARLAPALFEPWLHLARANLRAHDLFRARRALARAREADPRRFEREAPARVRAEGYELSALADVTSPGRMEAPVERQAAVLHARDRAVGGLPFGDCRDLDEYARFRSMPPITPGEIEEIDWDEVSEDLQDG
jgi:tetratricopeptide (TPR) repeat protein